jgi:hypothetical protein
MLIRYRRAYDSVRCLEQSKTNHAKRLLFESLRHPGSPHMYVTFEFPIYVLNGLK